MQKTDLLINLNKILQQEEANKNAPPVVNFNPTINVPKQEAPKVEVNLPPLNVNVPQSLPPTIEVNVPETIVTVNNEPPVINIPAPNVQFTIPDGAIKVVIEQREEEDEEDEEYEVQVLRAANGMISSLKIKKIYNGKS